MLDLLAQTGLNAVYAASYISLIAVGLVLIFGVMGVVNFAHGELYMAGAYAVVLLYTDFQIPFFVAIAVGMIFVGCLGLAMERALFRPLRDNPLGGLVASIGFLMILQSLAVMGFGVRMEHIPPVTQHVIEFSERVRLPLSRLFVIIAAGVLLGALWVFLKKTRFGWALRAAAQDPEAAALQGISINQTARIAMFIGAALGAAYGTMLHQWFPNGTSIPAGYALVGMGAVVAGVTHAPISAVLILFEMTDDYDVILPLMLAFFSSQYSPPSRPA